MGLIPLMKITVKSYLIAYFADLTRKMGNGYVADVRDSGAIWPKSLSFALSCPKFPPIYAVSLHGHRSSKWRIKQITDVRKLGWFKNMRRRRRTTLTKTSDSWCISNSLGGDHH